MLRWDLRRCRLSFLTMSNPPTVGPAPFSLPLPRLCPPAERLIVVAARLPPLGLGTIGSISSERSDLDKILDSTKVLKFLNLLPSIWPIIDFFRSGFATIRLKVSGSAIDCSATDPIGVFVPWSSSSSQGFETVTSIFGIGTELLRFRAG